MRITKAYGPIALMVCLYSISSFGPYAYGKIRFEHVCLLFFFVCAFMYGVSVRRLKFQSGQLRLLLFPTLILGLGLFSEVFIHGNSPFSQAKLSFLAAFGMSFLIPLFYSLALSVCSDGSRWALVGAVFYAFSLALALNSLLIIVQSIDPGAALPIIKFFHLDFDGGVDVSTAALSMYQGRYTGVFVQPFDAGISYSLIWIAAACGMYSYNSFGALVVGLNVLGGLLVGSKVFVLGGLPVGLAALVLIRSAMGYRGLSALPMMSFFWISVVFIFLVIVSPVRVPYIEGFMDLWSERSAVDVLSGGRFQTDGLDLNTEHVYQFAGLWGFGFGEVVPLDNSLVAYWGQGGIFAFFVYLTMLVWLAFRAWLGQGKVRVFGLAVIVLAVLASAGGPPFLVMRASTLLWFSVVVLVVLTERRIQNISSRNVRV
jgi:hypothetical protein